MMVLDAYSAPPTPQDAHLCYRDEGIVAFKTGPSSLGDCDLQHTSAGEIVPLRAQQQRLPVVFSQPDDFT